MRRDGQPLALWARDCGSAYPDVNLYSSWPYWLEVRPGAGPARHQLHATSSRQHFSRSVVSSCRRAFYCPSMSWLCVALGLCQLRQQRSQAGRSCTGFGGWLNSAVRARQCARVN